MNILLAVLLNAALLAVLLPWLRRQWRWAGTGRWQLVFGAGLGVRVGLGLVRCWHLQGDARFMSFVGHMVARRILRHPDRTWDILTRAVTVFPKDKAPYDFVFQNTSNTWILMKTLGVLNMASLQSDWINAVYLSLFVFVGSWQLVRVFAEAFPATPAGAAAVGFLFWPTTCFWATGISKEAVLLGSGAWLTAKVVAYCYGPSTALAQPWSAHLRWWLGAFVLALIHFGMRYFFAVPLIGALAGVALGRWLELYTPVRGRWGQAVALAVVLGTGAWLAPQLSVAFSLNKFTNQVITVYTFELAHAVGRPHFEYADLRPTIESFAAYAPLAAVNVITRPWLGESWRPLYVAAGLENAALLALLAVAGWAAWRKKGGHLPFGLGLGLVVFCLILAILMGLTTPNLGSLNRYRCELLSFLLLLLLQNDYAARGLRWLKRNE
jgi:hypothetical protein